MKKLKILILGGTGFVGRNVINVFKNSDFDVITHLGCNEINLKDTPKLTEYLKYHLPDYIINCAAKVGSLNYVSRNAANIITENIELLVSLYKSVVQSKILNTRIIHPIANCAYPATSLIFRESEWLNGPLHPTVMSYGSTRRMIWYIGESYGAQYGIRSYYFFVPNMYGPYDSTNPDKAHALNALVSKFVKADAEGKNQVSVWGTGVAIREWLYADDFGRVLLDFITNEKANILSEPINIGQNFGISIKNLVGLINSYWRNKFNIVWDDTMPDGAPRKVMSNELFRNYFPNFIFTPIEKGLISTIEYYKSIYPY